MEVLDFCAGAGGKTLAMAAEMENKGSIFAYDAEKQRLSPIFERLTRAGVTNVEVVSRLAALEGRAESFDLVLVDAPCTGSGTWRRRPDAKWRLSDRQLDDRRGEQSAILDRAAGFVKPGGRLVYITCSVFEEENADQISAFLARTPGWMAEDHEALWSSRFPEARDKAYVSQTEGIRLSPGLTATDGFYFAALRRAGAGA
jgi:16S rRNA (cytosine967-C5)-methyltransferase